MEWIWVIQIAAIIILFIDAFYVAMQKPSRMQIYLLLMALFTNIMMIGYLVEIAAYTLDGAMAGVKVAYVGKPFAILFSLLFVAEYCGHAIPKKWIAVLIAYHAIFPIIIYTNEFHHLYYSSVGFNDVGQFSSLVISRGPLYFLYMITLAANFIVTLVLTINEYRSCKTKTGRRQAILIMAMFVSTVVGYGIYLAGLTSGYDSTMAGAFVGVVLLTITFISGGFFDSLTMAKDRALDDAAMGLLVLDSKQKKVYSNKMVKSLMQQGVSVDGLKALPEGISKIHNKDRVLEISRTTLENRGRDFGTTFEISDVTENHNYSTMLEQEVESRTQEIRHIQRSIIASFAQLVEARDDSTGTHINRVSRYTELIARELQADSPYSDVLTDDFITILVDVAPLHDIGKIGIPDSVLLKPGRLTEGEYATIKTHTTNGAKVIHECLDGVEQESYIKMAEEVALCHHEWWNGIGYPKSISGEEIPLAARIVAVADVYDAVRSKRCYKDAFSPEKSRDEIVKDTGTHFDPVVVSAFLKILPEIEAFASETEAKAE